MLFRSENLQDHIDFAFSYRSESLDNFGVSFAGFRKLWREIGRYRRDGVGMITSIVSALTGVAVRKEVAMTGEISLRGRVMPIGGLKEKLLAALRGGLKTVLIPKENERDLPEIPDNVKKGLEIVPVATVDEVLARALVKPLVAIEWPNDLEPAVPAKPAEGAEVRAH